MNIVDASVALRWSIQDGYTPLAQELVSGGGMLVAPDLVVPEVTNALWKMRRSGLIGEEQANRALAEIPQAYTMLVPTSGLIRRAFSIAATLDHPAYDCFYLALSEELGAPLVTLDKRLHARTRGTPWEALTVLLGNGTVSA